MTAIPMTAADLTDALASVPDGARVYVMTPVRSARSAADFPGTTVGAAITGLIVRGGDVYLETEEDGR